MAFKKHVNGFLCLVPIGGAEWKFTEELTKGGRNMTVVSMNYLLEAGVLPKETEDIVFKATNKDLSLRYKSANEMKNDIERLYQNKSVISKSFNFFDRIFNSKRRK